MAKLSSNPLAYPKAQQDFDAELFRSPSAEYRGAPLWSWNTKLEREMLLKQIDDLKEMGMGGFHMHVRVGLDTEYMGDEFMGHVQACVKYAAEKGMLACLYDEDRWPSGCAGGLVTKNNPEYASQHILLTPVKYGDGVTSQPPAFMGYPARSELGVLIARYDIRLNDTGELCSYRRLEDDEEPALDATIFYAYMEPNIPSPWFNGETYADTLNADAIHKFIELTHEKYKKNLAADFGHVIPSIFCDEPQFQGKTQLPKATSTIDTFLPWTRDLPRSFKATYGYEILDMLPEIVWNLPKASPSLARYHFHDHVCERFVTAFMDQLSTWCKGNGIALTGHMMEEPFLKTQTASLGEAMRCYRGLDLPGVDMLCDQFEYNTVKQATSVARQNGARGAMCEIYGVTNWTFTFEGHKGCGDWQAALGITFRVHHLTWVSMAGEAKRDFPACIGYQSPWYKEYSVIEDYFSRLNVVLTRGKPVTRVAVIHPIESYWLCYGPVDSGKGEPEFREQCFRDLTHWLLHGLVDFDFISESLFPEQTTVESIQNRLTVGNCVYDAVIVPNLRTIRSTTLLRLRAFAAAGGTVILAGEQPSLVNATVPSEPPTISGSLSVPWTEYHLLGCIEPFRDVRIETTSGKRAGGLLYQLREDKKSRFLFICNTERIDGVSTHVYIKGNWQALVMDTFTGGAESELETSQMGEWTVFPYYFEGTASVLLWLREAPPTSAAQPQRPLGIRYGKTIGEVVLRDVVLSEPNVLLLDYAEHRLSADSEWEPLEEVLRIENTVRKRLNLPLKLDNFKQPWAISPTERQSLDDLHLRFTFNTGVDIPTPILALEDASSIRIFLNGSLVSSKNPSGFWVDEAVKKIILPPIQKGTQTLELVYPFGIMTNIERVYLLGDFGVNLRGRDTEVVEQQKLTFGDWTRQGLPFYAGNTTYKCDFELPPGPPLCVALSVPQFVAPVLSITLDSQPLGHIFIEPRMLELGLLKSGRHSLEITSFGNRENAFGMIHLVEGVTTWFGPNEFRTDRQGWWQREYNVKRMGVLTAPTIVGLGNHEVAVQPHILRFPYERANQRS